MSRIDLPTANAIKSCLMRARARLEQIGDLPLDSLTRVSPELFSLSLSTYEFCSALGLPAIKHTSALTRSPLWYYDDTIQNLDTAIRIELTSINVSPEPGFAEEGVNAASSIEAAVLAIPVEAGAA